MGGKQAVLGNHLKGVLSESSYPFYPNASQTANHRCPRGWHVVAFHVLPRDKCVKQLPNCPGPFHALPLLTVSSSLEIWTFGELVSEIYVLPAPVKLVLQ